jgi:hypothetical protein
VGLTTTRLGRGVGMGRCSGCCGTCSGSRRCGAAGARSCSSARVLPRDLRHKGRARGGAWHLRQCGKWRAPYRTRDTREREWAVAKQHGSWRRQHDRTWHVQPDGMGSKAIRGSGMMFWTCGLGPPPPALLSIRRLAGGSCEGRRRRREPRSVEGCLQRSGLAAAPAPLSPC